MSSHATDLVVYAKSSSSSKFHIICGGVPSIKILVTPLSISQLLIDKPLRYIVVVNSRTSSSSGGGGGGRGRTDCL